MISKNNLMELFPNFPFFPTFLMPYVKSTLSKANKS